MTTKGYTVLGWLVWKLAIRLRQAPSGTDGWHNRAQGRRRSAWSQNWAEIGAAVAVELVRPAAPAARSSAARMIADTERLLIRSWSPEDVEAAHVVPVRPARLDATSTTEPSTRSTRPACGSTAHARLEREHGYTLWAVVEREASGELMGDCGLIPLERSRARGRAGLPLRAGLLGHGLRHRGGHRRARPGLRPLRPRSASTSTSSPRTQGSLNVARKLGARLLGPATHQGEQVLRFVLEPPEGVHQS